MTQVNPNSGSRAATRGRSIPDAKQLPPGFYSEHFDIDRNFYRGEIARMIRDMVSGQAVDPTNLSDALMSLAQLADSFSLAMMADQTTNGGGSYLDNTDHANTASIISQLLGVCVIAADSIASRGMEAGS